MNKELLRTEMRARYAAVDLDMYVANALQQIERNAVFREARHVLAYDPIRSLEIPFVSELMGRHPDKVWYVPEVVGDGEMMFVERDTRQQTASLVDNRLEPAAARLYRLHRSTCVLVPALSLDTHGNRLGKGGGYYDRFLGAYQSIVPNTLSVVPEFAFIDALPVEEHDVRVTCALKAMRE